MCYWYYLVCLIPGHWLLTCYLKQVIVLVICFLPCLLTRYWFIYVSNTCVISFVSFAFTVCGITLNRSLVRFHCIWHHLLTRYWCVQCQQHLYNRVILQYNSGKMAAEFEQVTVLIRLFFTWILCIYIILGEGCHILYVFRLNSLVCSHIVGEHLSSDQCFFTASAYQKFLTTFRVY